MYTELIWLENVSDRTCVGFFAKLLSEKIRSSWGLSFRPHHTLNYDILWFYADNFTFEKIKEELENNNKLIWIWMGFELDTNRFSTFSKVYLYGKFTKRFVASFRSTHETECDLHSRNQWRICRLQFCSFQDIIAFIKSIITYI